MKKIKEVLISLGYRHMGKNVWGKPIAHHIFLYNIPNSTWKNVFKGIDEKLHIWESKIYKKDETVTDDFLQFIKYLEQYTRISTDCQSNFEFLTMEERANLIVDKV